MIRDEYSTNESFEMSVPWWPKKDFIDRKSFVKKYMAFSTFYLIIR